MRLVYLFLLIIQFNIVFSQENTALLCSDGIDNDGDGLIDCADNECVEIPTDGCLICTDGLSFADLVIGYESGCAVADTDPDGALGVSDYMGGVTDTPDYVFLGEGGFIKLQFTDNLLSNSGDTQDDLYVFEVGGLVEPLTLSLRPTDSFTISALNSAGFQDIDNDGFYRIDDLGGSTTSIDIDFYLQGYMQGLLVFDAVELRDIDDRPCMGGVPGADIDAVCALYYLPIDCNDVVGGSSIIDICGECLEPTDPDFDQSCVDCAGVVDGTSVIDICGECLEPADPDFNQRCVDCAGVIDGTSVIDICGECLEPTDPDFNQSCVDCAGIVDGTSVIDICGECLEPTDPDFDQNCVDCAGVLNGKFELDACGECLDPIDPLFSIDCFIDKTIYIPNVILFNQDINGDFRFFPSNVDVVDQIIYYGIYDRWGNLVYEKSDIEFENFDKWWEGTFNNELAEIGCYTYMIELSYSNSETCKFVGNITLLR